jgi:AcrR family transcriptional regulator
MVIKKEIISLTREDWIQKGLSTLASHGIESVRVEPLAKIMGVTKGSFYWHFKNREDLLTGILQKWVRVQTNSIIQQVNELLGFAPFEAMVRARMAYYSLVGEFTIGIQYDQAERLAEIRIQHKILTQQN